MGRTTFDEKAHAELLALYETSEFTIGHDNTVVLFDVCGEKNRVVSGLDWKGAAYIAAVLIMNGEDVLKANGYTAAEARDMMFSHIIDSQKRVIQERTEGLLNAE